MHFRTSAVIVMVVLRLQYLMKQYMSRFVLGSPEKTQGKGNSKSTDLL